MEIITKNIQLKCTEEERRNVEKTLENVCALRDMLSDKNLYLFDNCYGNDIDTDELDSLVYYLNRLSDAISSNDRFELKEYN